MPTVLLIEDDLAVEALLTEILMEVGYHIVTASPTDYRTVAQTCCPDIVLIGWQPRGNFGVGWRMARELGSLLPNCRFVMLSTNPASLDEVGHTPRGHIFSACLLQPFLVDDLIRAIDQTIGPS